MIRLHQGREGERPVWVNAELIETVEATPDTVITLLTGRKLLVTRRRTSSSRWSWSTGGASHSRPHVLTGG